MCLVQTVNSETILHLEEGKKAAFFVLWKSGQN